jgi:hypothetical protein
MGPVVRRLRLRVRQQFLGGGFPDVGRNIVPLMVQTQILVLDRVAASRVQARIDPVGIVGIDQLSRGVEVDRADM